MVAYRLQDEYGVQCVFEGISLATARWIDCADPKKLAEFPSAATSTSRSTTPASWFTSPRITFYLNMVKEKFPNLRFDEAREVA